ncbi:MAG: GHKL domain-containing protein [Oscillospiraceae bacterium]|nr:GHKL domain-containing protein [Oscillospiraceae bacterium]
MIGTIIELMLILVAHATAGIYSSNLKYSKKTTYIIWGAWIVLQTALLFYTETSLANWPLQFFFGFIFPLVGQYVIFFATTKDKLAQRIFTMMTYSIFFCIITAPFIIVKDMLSELHWSLTVLVQAVLLFGIVIYFLRCVCPLCRKAAKNITTGWAPLIFVNIVFLITIILSSIFPVRLSGFTGSAFITFVFLSISILSVYPVIFSNINSLSEAAMKKAVETQNKLLVAQIEAENAQRAADSHARHDRRHHNLMMLEYANNGDLESVKEYLGSLVESDNEVRGEVRYCENMTMNTVLTVYERRAKENGICVTISADGSRDLSVLPRDLVIVIANLFENAINATAKLKKIDKRIDILIKESAQRLVVKVENPCKANLAFDESNFGVGIRSVIATATKYEGMYDFTAEDGIFSAKIILNLK